MGAVVQAVRRVLADDADSKCLVFSTWRPLGFFCWRLDQPRANFGCNGGLPYVRWVWVPLTSDALPR